MYSADYNLSNRNSIWTDRLILWTSGPTGADTAIDTGNHLIDLNHWTIHAEIIQCRAIYTILLELNSASSRNPARFRWLKRIQYLSIPSSYVQLNKVSVTMPQSTYTATSVSHIPSDDQLAASLLDLHSRKTANDIYKKWILHPITVVTVGNK